MQIHASTGMWHQPIWRKQWESCNFADSWELQHLFFGGSWNVLEWSNWGNQHSASWRSWFWGTWDLRSIPASAMHMFHKCVEPLLGDLILSPAQPLGKVSAQRKPRTGWKCTCFVWADQTVFDFFFKSKYITAPIWPTYTSWRKSQKYKYTPESAPANVSEVKVCTFRLPKPPTRKAMLCHFI